MTSNFRPWHSLCVAALIMLSAAVAATSPVPGTTGPDSAGAAATPDYYLWAWRRTEDLSFVESERINAAIWTGTIFWKEGKLRVDRRLNPITYPADMKVVAVARLEIDGIPDPAATARIAETLQEIGKPFNPVEYQVDFDARLSQRAFYRRLLDQVRTRTGSTRLSIAALASWCFHDSWIEELPIDAAVPMIYRMGPEGGYIRRKLKRERMFPAAICRGNVGYSSDEPLAPVDGLERVFLFHPRPWTEERLATLLDRSARL
ncbi:MAG: hypothetical protein F4133_04595 [Gammaproteobacteria bacterium]|nr:hypothetical protein [Gammaproteobacteria bacterium]